MNLSHNTQAREQLTVTISPTEYFDYQSARDFHQAFTDRQNANADFVVDLNSTRYIDSCALGMLLSLDKHTRRARRTMTVINCDDHVQKIFSVVRFDKRLSFG